MQQNAPSVFGQGEPETVPGNAGKWDLYRSSFLNLVAAEARLQIIAGVSPAEMPGGDENALENAVVRAECARLVYNDSRNTLASALLHSVEGLEPQPGRSARIRCVARVADLLSEFRGNGPVASPEDKTAAERIISAAHSQFLEQQRA